MRLLISVGLFALLMGRFAQVSAAERTEGSAAREDYRVKPGDLVRIQIFQEPDLDREVRISQEGAITLPLIGQVEVKGRSLREITETIRELYDRDYLVNPQVSVSVSQYKDRKVNVLGALNSPGQIILPPEDSMTLVDAISKAGGLNRMADSKRVRLTRTRSDGQQENFIINFEDLTSGKKSDVWILRENDVIHVPERLL